MQAGSRAGLLKEVKRGKYEYRRIFLPDLYLDRHRDGVAENGNGKA
jgi:hypothetical protein